MKQQMTKLAGTITTTLSRDFTTLLSRRVFWCCWAFFLLLASLFFFAYFDDFLAIQPSLRAKNVTYGVTDLVIAPYFRTMGGLSLLVIVGLSARTFFWERFSSFAQFIRSTNNQSWPLIMAKLLTISLQCIILLLTITLPIWVSGFFFEYNQLRVFLILFALFMLLLSAGLLSAVFSLVFSHSVLVVLLTLFVLFGLEIMARLWVEPTWLAPIISYFSPIQHASRMTTGILLVSDAVFFLNWVLAGIAIANRLFANSYLTMK